MMRWAHLYSFLEVITPRKVTEMRSGSMDRVVHPCIQSSSNDNVSLSGDITPKGPLVQMRGIDASISEVPILDFSSVETLGQLVTAMGALGKTKEEGIILSPSF